MVVRRGLRITSHVEVGGTLRKYLLVNLSACRLDWGDSAHSRPLDYESTSLFLMIEGKTA
jgi:hypothetical protein